MRGARARDVGRELHKAAPGSEGADADPCEHEPFASASVRTDEYTISSIR